MLESFIMHKNSFLKTIAAILVTTALGAFAQEKKQTPPAAPEAKPQEPLKGMVKVTIETSKGSIELELDADKAPISVANFLSYAKKGFYGGTIFHRVIPNFMIQGGGFTADMNQKESDKAIQNEAKNGLKNTRGTIAMARTPEPHSASSQWFINVKDNDALDYPGQDGWGYCVFGKVTKGMDVVDAIAAIKTGASDVPVEPIIIKSAKIAE